jgi:hypothetical protein
MKILNLINRFSDIVLFLVLLTSFPAKAQQTPGTTIVKGVVTDAETNDPLPFIGIMFAGSVKNATITDHDGLFTIVTNDTSRTIKASCVGYETSMVTVEPGKRQYISIKLKPTVNPLTEVVISGRRKKRYKNRDNPAVEIIQKVIDNKSKNRMESLSYLEYEKYEKIVFSFNNVKDELKDNRFLQHFRFIFDNVDTTIVSGKELIPIYLKETLSDYYYRKTPRAVKEIVKAEKLVRFDEYVNGRSVSASLNYLYQDIDIYENNVTVLSNQFLSPIALLAPAFYRYYIKDTSYVDGIKCVNLNFFPRSKTDMLFQGEMYVTLDSTYAVRKIDMTVNKDINLNWVRGLKIIQEFDKTEGTGWMITRDEMWADFGITQGSIGLFGQRKSSYRDCKINQPANDSLYKGMPLVLTPGAENRDETGYWDVHRHMPLRPSEQNIYLMMDSLKRVPAFRRDMDIITTITAGYYKKAGWFELGPVSTFYSYNPIEGSRAKLGGRTTPKFSKKINLDSYLAYGFTDKKYKGYFGTTYSLSNRTYNEFPIKSVTASYEYDIKIPGQELEYAKDDNLLISAKRGVNDKMFYNRLYRLDHYHEYQNHFSYDFSYEYSQKATTGNLYLNTGDYREHLNSVDHIDVSQVNLSLRFAPHEKFFQGSMYRTPFPNKYPVMQLQYTLGSKILGSDYNFQNLRLNVSKRFNLSVLGYTDVSFEAGKVLGRVPYLLLDIHRANQSYTYQAESYNLMNFLEFISDQYTSISVDHCFNGFFFNKIPLMKKLRFREVVTGKLLYGELSNTNNPALHPDMFQLPVNDNGTPLTYTLEKMPYIELGAGVSNILRIFRVDFIQRITYLDHPGISKSGLRFGVKFDF